MTVLLESQKNIGDSILYLFPNAVVDHNFKVINDGESFKLVKWEMDAVIPTVEELESVYEKAQEGRNEMPISELDVIKKQQTDLAFELMQKGVL